MENSPDVKTNLPAQKTSTCGHSKGNIEHPHVLRRRFLTMGTAPKHHIVLISSSTLMVLQALPYLDKTCLKDMSVQILAIDSLYNLRRVPCMCSLPLCMYIYIYTVCISILLCRAVLILEFQGASRNLHLRATK